MAIRAINAALVRGVVCLALAVCWIVVHAAGGGGADVSADHDSATAGLETLEERLRADPYDREARQGLIEHFWRGRLRGGADARRHAELVLWLVGNAPRDPLLDRPEGQIDPALDPERYVSAKRLWLGHLDGAPDDLVLLRNAASFLERREPELAVSLLESAQDIEPTNPVWPFEIGQLRWGNARFRSAPADRAELELAASLFERAYALAGRGDELLPMYALHAIRGTFDAGRHADAEAYANDALNRTGSVWWDGDVRHHANLVLGRIALAQEDVARAKAHLLAAGRVARSPTLGSFGPNMRLARELVERGEREVVLEYFDLCSRFWNPDTLGAWADVVAAGRTPDFGANLLY